MKMFYFLLSVVSIMVITSLGLIAYENPHPSDEEWQQTLIKYHCQMTDEFVGRNAERLYECNGHKYREEALHQWAVQDIMDKR